MDLLKVEANGIDSLNTKRGKEEQKQEAIARNIKNQDQQIQEEEIRLALEAISLT